MLNNKKLNEEELLKNHTKEEVVGYIEELYSRYDNLELNREKFKKMNFNINKKETRGIKQ